MSLSKAVLYGLTVLGTSFLLVRCQTVKDEDSRPNFIVIYTDDQRMDALGSYGNESIITPYLDKYLSQGMQLLMPMWYLPYVAQVGQPCLQGGMAVPMVFYN